MDERLGSLTDRWRSAEQRLYPIVLVDPRQYEIYVRLVRAIADDLKDRSTAEELAEAYDERSRLLTEVVHRLSLTGAQIDDELVLDAAFHARYRELRSERQQAEATQRIAAAGGEPQWVLLAESGPASPVPMPGYRRLEMHIPDGLGLHAFVEFDPETYAPIYGFEVLRLDPRTGQHVNDGGSADRHEFPDPEEWEQARAEKRREHGD